MTDFKSIATMFISFGVDKRRPFPMPKTAAILLALGLSLVVPVSGADCGLLCDRDWMSSATLADVRAELEEGSDPSASAPAGRTALHTAAQMNGDPAVAGLLLDRGADLEARTTSYGQTPLHGASGGTGIEGWGTFNDMYGVRLKKLSAMKSLHVIEEFFGKFSGNRPAVVALLLDRGADISAADHRDRTPLHHAAAVNSDPGIITLLLDRGAAVDARGESGLTPLHAAAWSNRNPDIVELLVERGADINSNNNDMYVMPLHLAAVNLNPEVPKRLLKLGASIEARDEDGKQPIHAAAEHSLPEVIDLLVDNGADLNSGDIWNRTPLRYALGANPNPDVAIRLIEKGGDLDIRDVEGKSPRSIGISEEMLDMYRWWSEVSTSRLQMLLERRPSSQ